jgi:hypothetical protein
MARRRDDDYEDDDIDDRPARGRARDDDDDYDDRPARRSGGAKGPVDGMLGNTAVAIILALVSFCCCPLLGLIIGGIGMGTTRDPDVKRNSIIVLVAAVVGIVLNVILVVTGNVPNFQNMNR